MTGPGFFETPEDAWEAADAAMDVANMADHAGFHGMAEVATDNANWAMYVGNQMCEAEDE